MFIMSLNLIPVAVRKSYEIHQWRHACGILKQDFPQEFHDIVDVLGRFRLSKSALVNAGGNKNPLTSGWIDGEFKKKGWCEKDFDVRIKVDETERLSPTHSIDCFKNRVGLEIEWNNKDPFFDRDLNNFRLLHSINVLSVGVIVTRCDELQDIVRGLGRGGYFRRSKVVARGDVPCWCLEYRGGFMTKIVSVTQATAERDLLAKVSGRYATILADPPWQFQNRTGKVAPEHKRLLRYPTMEIQEILQLPVGQLAAAQSHLYLWVPNALVGWGLDVMRAWGFTYKTNLVWYKIRNDGGPDGRGVGFYFRNVTELILFGVRGGLRTLQPGRTQVNLFATRKREHSRKPDEIYDIIETCSPGPYLELFARFRRAGWRQWGNEDVEANTQCGVAMRKGHADVQIRLLELPMAYRAVRKS
jgi:N6-adenosine-specific RNA methylase IME4